MDFKNELKARSEIFETELKAFCLRKNGAVPDRLWDAMNYSLLAGGKRLRPVLCMAGAEVSGMDPRSVMPMAIALEMAHTASLIHDDLPCMDNDTLRRGRPTNHVVYGEAMALLAGDALFLGAFETAMTGLAAQGLSAERIQKAMALFAGALGPAGICGGQVFDSDPESREERQDFVMTISSAKTMVLIRAALCCGALLAGASGERLDCLMRYGEKIGIAFQIADDLLDCVGDQASMGKTLGKDEAQDKRTFVRAYGIQGSRDLLHRMTLDAEEALKPFGEKAAFLQSLAAYLEIRTR